MLMTMRRWSNLTPSNAAIRRWRSRTDTRRVRPNDAQGVSAALHRVCGDHELAELLRAGLRQIRGHRLDVIQPDHGATRRARDHVVADESRAGAADDGHADAGQRVADHVAGDDDVPEIAAPAGDDAVGGGVFHDVAGHRGIRLDIDADAGVVVGRGADRALRDQVADDVALDDGDAAAFVEVADGDAEGGAI